MQQFDINNALNALVPVSNVEENIKNLDEINNNSVEARLAFEDKTVDVHSEGQEANWMNTTRGINDDMQGHSVAQIEPEISKNVPLNENYQEYDANKLNLRYDTPVLGTPTTRSTNHEENESVISAATPVLHEIALDGKNCQMIPIAMQTDTTEVDINVPQLPIGMPLLEKDQKGMSNDGVAVQQSKATEIQPTVTHEKSLNTCNNLTSIML